VTLTSTVLTASLVSPPFLFALLFSSIRTTSFETELCDYHLFCPPTQATSLALRFSLSTLLSPRISRLFPRLLVVGSILYSHFLCVISAYPLFPRRSVCGGLQGFKLIVMYDNLSLRFFETVNFPPPPSGKVFFPPFPVLPFPFHSEMINRQAEHKFFVYDRVLTGQGPLTLVCVTLPPPPPGPLPSRRSQNSRFRCVQHFRPVRSWFLVSLNECDKFFFCFLAPRAFSARSSLGRRLAAFFPGFSGAGACFFRYPPPPASCLNRANPRQASPFDSRLTTASILQRELNQSIILTPMTSFTPP